MNHITKNKPPHRYSVFVFYIFVFLASVGLVKWQLNNSMDIWFYDSDPQLIIHKATLEEMGEWEWLIVVMDTKINIYDPKFLDELQVIGNQVESLDNVKKVMSIANARGTFNDNTGLEYRTLYNSDQATHESLDEQLRQSLLNNPVFVDSLFRVGQESTTVMLVQDANAFDEGGPARIDLINNIKVIMDDTTFIADYRIVGTTALSAALNTYSLRDVFTFYPLVFSICIIFGWWVFGNWRDLVVALSIVSAAVSTTISIMVYSGFALNMITVMLPAILTALSMASAVHVITHFHQLRKVRPDDSLDRIATQVARNLWVPCLSSALTTIAGFATLSFTGIVPIIQLGFFVAVGIFLGFVLTISITPLLLVYFWSGKEHLYNRASRSLATHANHVLASAAPRIIKTTWPAILIFCFVAVVGIAGLASLKADSSYLMMFNEDSEIRNSYAQTERTGFAASSLQIFLEMENGLEDPATFFSLDRLQQAISKLPQITKVVSPLDGFKEIDRSVAKDEYWTEDNYLNYVREEFAQLLFVGELSNNDDMEDVLLPGNKIGQMFIFTDYLSNGEVRKLVDEIEDLIAKYLPVEIKASVTGQPVLWANMDRQLFSSQINSLLIMIVAILATLLVITRSLSLSIVGLVVNLLPVMIIIGSMAWLDIKLNIGTTLVGGIALGVAVDDTIHFLWRYVKERRKGICVQDALITTIKTTGLAIFLTSVLIAASFSVMILSQFIPTVDFGLFTASSILLATIIDLFLLPAILMVLYGNKQKWAGV